MTGQYIINLLFIIECYLLLIKINGEKSIIKVILGMNYGSGFYYIL